MREQTLAWDEYEPSARHMSSCDPNATAGFRGSAAAVADASAERTDNPTLPNRVDRAVNERASEHATWLTVRLRQSKERTTPKLRRSLVIEPGCAIRHYWADLWRYRELLYILAWRDVVVRYKQTVIGVAWALLRPALTLLVFVVFRQLGDFEAHGFAPEPVLVLAAVLPWQLVSTVLSDSSTSLIENGGLISKVYFPRLLIPAASAVTALVEFSLTLGLLVLLMLWYGVPLGWHLIALPLFVVLALSVSFGLGVFLAAMNVRYRDFRYIVPFCIQFSLFVSPVAFTTSDVPEQWRTLYALNPLAGVIDGFRWSIFSGRSPLDLHVGGVSVIVGMSCLLFGTWYFRRTERSFADVI
jgi:lipopolysaccharide transport system permease protein